MAVNDPEIRKELDDLKQGATFAAGSFSLAVAPATSTVVTRRGVSSASVICTQAYSALASNSDITRIVPAKDSFTVTHSSSANARTHRYSFVTPIG